MTKSHITQAILLLTFITLSIYGCKIEDDPVEPPPPPPPPTYSITAKIDTTEWIGMENTATIEDGLIIIQGISEPIDSIADTINIIIHSEAIGSFQFDQNTDNKAYFIDSTATFSTDAHSSAEGVVIITDINTIDSTISGSFHFDLFDITQNGERKKITEGVIQDLKTTFHSNLTTEFTAKIDGSPWAGTTNVASVTEDLITLSSIDGNGEGFAISIFSEYPGTFTLNENSDHVASYSGSSGIYWTNADSLAGGQVIINDINTIDSTITGMFFFEVYDSISGTYKSITEGSFNKIDFSILHGGGNGTMILDVDGENWMPDIISGISSYGILNLSGTDFGSSRTLNFRLPLSITTGSYNFPLVGNYYASYTESNEVYYATIGELSITKHDTATNEIEGTFNFDGTEETEASIIYITNGSFSIEYVE